LALSGKSRSIPIALIVAAILIALIYFGFPCNRYLSDGLKAAILMRDSHGLYVHPNHVLYPLLPGLLFDLIGDTASGLSELEMLTLWSMLAGVVACWGLIIALRAGSMTVATTIAVLGLFAFFKGIWYFSVIPSPSSSALAAQVCALAAIALAARTLPSGPSSRAVSAVGFFTSLAILTSQMNAALIFPAIYVIWLSNKPQKAKALAIVSYLGITAVTALAVIVVFGVAFAGIRSPNDLLSWQHSYVYDSRWWIHGFVDAIRRNWVGANDVILAFLFRPDGLFGNWSEGWGTTLWLARLPVRVGQAAVLLFMYVEILKAVVRYVRDRRRALIQTIGLAVALPLMIFSFFWTPETFHYRILYIPGLMMFLAPSIERSYSLDRFRLRRAWPVLLVVFALIATNLTTQFLPQSDPANNPHRGEVLFLAPYVGPGDVIIYSGTGDSGMRALYAEYFLHCKTIRVNDLIPSIRQRPDEVIRDLTDLYLQGHNILIHGDAIYSAEDVEYMNRQYHMDIGPTEMLDFVMSWTVPVDQAAFGDQHYYWVAPKGVLQ
jgi:hypothetical protein